MLKAVLFDLDGVIVDSEPGVAKMFQRVISEFGFPKPKEAEIHSHFGKPADETIRLLLPEVKDRELLARMHERTVTATLETIPYMRLAPVAGLLPRIKESHKVALVTNRRASAYNVLAHFALTNCFDAVVTHFDAPAKPAPDMIRLALGRLGVLHKQAVYFGDQQVDLLAGNAAGVKTYLVGPRTKEDFYSKLLLV
jgi:HAD superfamily hydrolase (TIGR01509 family)